MSEQIEAIRQTAYFLWEQDGRPVGRAEEYWARAEEAHRRQADYDRWLRENSPAETAPAEPAPPEAAPGETPDNPPREG